MTRGEADLLSMFVSEFREFRGDDREWKSDMDDRLRRVEAYVTSRRAVDERESSRAMVRRAWVASAISAIGVVIAILLRVLNA